MPETAFHAGTAGQRPAPAPGATQQEQAKEVASLAQDKAREAGQQMRGRLHEQVDQRSTRIGEQIRGASSDVRTFARQLREQGKEKPAEYAEQAADRVERIGSYLDESDGKRILHDVEDFGRRNQWAVVTGGVALGFMASRLLKASSTERYRAQPQRFGATQDHGSAPVTAGSSIEPHAATSGRVSQYEPRS